MKNKKYSKAQFSEDLKRLLALAEEMKLPFIGSDPKTYRVTFEDRDLGLVINIYCSQMTVCFGGKRWPMGGYLYGQSWENITDIFHNLYRYI